MKNGVELCGDKICKTECDMGVKIKMTQDMCGMGGFLAQKACVLGQYLLKVLEMCGMGGLSVTPFTEKLFGVTQKCVEWGVKM